MVAEGRAETTTTKATWLLEQLAPIARNAIADLKPVEVLAALKRPIAAIPASVSKLPPTRSVLHRIRSGRLRGL
jgi:hypothetical protein